MVDPFKCHSKDYFSDTKELFTNTSHLNEKLSLSSESIVIFHGLFGKTFSNLLPQLINSSIKTGWTVWGGDVKLLQKRENVKLLNKLDFVCCSPGEFFPYPNFSVPQIHMNMYLTTTQPLPKIQKEDLIVLGNSGDPSNNHGYLLRIAQKFERAKIHIPFAYGGSESYLKKLSSLSKQIGIFERVYFQTEIMSLADYSNLFNRAKVFLTAHDRQQAAGSIQIAYTTNCEVYLKKNITTYDNKMTLNPLYLTLLMMGYTDLKDITSIDNPKVRVNLPIEIKNTLLDLNITNPDYIESVFEMLKRNT